MYCKKILKAVLDKYLFSNWNNFLTEVHLRPRERGLPPDWFPLAKIEPIQGEIVVLNTVEELQQPILARVP